MRISDWSSDVCSSDLLVAATNFSFLRGASHPGEMVKVAVALKYDAIGIADRNSVAGVVRAPVALKELREEFGAAITCRLLVGARLVFAHRTPAIVASPATRFGWGRQTARATVGEKVC